MKIGQQFPLTMEGHVVAYAAVEDIDDGKVYLIIPATRVVMGLGSHLTDLDPEVDRAFAGLEEKEVEAPVGEEPRSLRDMDLSSDAVDVDEVEGK